MSVENSKNLWILTEERPKIDVLKQIILKFTGDYKIAASAGGDMRIVPILNNRKFSFTYELTGFHCDRINKILIKTVSGHSSFVDYLIFYQEKEPNPSADIPIYAIEETKTDDSESRNTGVYQRCSKFVYLDIFYPDTRKIMLYNLHIKQKKSQTETNIFGTRMLLTLNVEILGKTIENENDKPFLSIDELIEFKGSMREPPAGNVPINITKNNDTIYISGRLYKSGGLSHDPSIGALSIIAATLRKLGWHGKIVITEHGLSQKNIGSKNKFILIANKINILIDGLVVPKTEQHKGYWYYDIKGEKLGTIFIHLLVENFTDGRSIYENHAGCERGYFLTSSDEPITIKKYTNRSEYKKGDKSKIINLPDLTLLDPVRKEILNIEGEMFGNKLKGIEQLSLFGAFENIYIKRHYPDYAITRSVVLYGGDKGNETAETEVGFVLESDGNLILGVKAPEIFRDAIKRLRDFWS